MQIEVQKTDITQLKVDAVVNAANQGLWAGGGVCGAIFEAAGFKELQAACREIGHCDTGSAVITPGFKLNAKNVIHAVGPVWQDGMHGEPTLLYNVYIHSLELAAKNGCNSIAFPLISAGIYGYPKQAAWIQAITACRDFLLRKKSSIRVIFAVIDDEMFIMGQKTIQSILG